MNVLRNVIIIIFSLSFSIIFLHFILHLNTLKIVDQRKLDKSILWYLDRYYHTFFPNTFDRDLKNYTAILGDSYAFGEGDGWLEIEKDYKYSTPHYLNKLNGENYINFGLPGGRSVTSFREFFFRYNKILSSKFLPKIDQPKKMIFFFYEGNDIIDNITYFKKRKLDTDDINKFVKAEIENFNYYNNRHFNIYFPVINSTKNALLDKFIHYIYIPYIYPIRSKFNKRIKNNLKIMESKNRFLNYITFEGGKTRAFDSNVENPGYFLSKNEINTSINIFFSFIFYFKKKFPNTEIEILYIPSASTIYEWSNNLIVKVPDKEYIEINHQNRNEFYNYIIENFKILSKKRNIKFFNSTEQLKKIAQKEPLHGNLDDMHFNLLGYQTLANVLLD